MQEYSGAYKGIPRYTGVYNGLQGHTGVYKGIPGYTRVYKGIPGYEGVYKGIAGYTSVQCTLVYPGIPFYTLYTLLYSCIYILFDGFTYNTRGYFASTSNEQNVRGYYM